MWRRIFRWLLAVFFVVAGVNHFLNPAPYLAMMPKYLPWPEFLHLMAGVVEVVAGVAVLIPRLRRLAGWGMMAILVAVFPANVQIAMFGWPGYDIPNWVLWARLPFQLVFMVWVWWTCLARGANGRR
ncbi:DoxX family membrane protein [Phragmitibacter flavus]|uniref:DoxX family membrane protein n=1 Tax=Phragmitibacter flavus TaxID=2576071 RepID=A0A5R8KHR8_9BACT|nr:DoxX family membrane protein [Phragmitibacter flavus]TLD71858.1 DoxX family membrane protein [Phragmitibacter flavus]